MNQFTKDQAEKALQEKGHFILLHSSTDCDGVTLEWTTTYSSMKEYEDDMELIAESIEGPYSQEIVEEEQETQRIGMGWDIK